ncbi:hypothetical protein CAK95_13970 [Pseudorhodoplanes sinuspersici]|uniref:DUF2809 domain-containing protein n=1 Tax=Pseudorhodoplanes sinuspersici TaxID=1235591 RepID=A0A1W6ZZZ7_9HYPH|nr:hypothetical protein CAK95_13970 [Pseudorhodoplanes sinuspersici]
MKLRLIYAALGLALVALGLLWRWPVLNLPPVVAKYGGSVLWGVLVYVCVRVALPNVAIRIVVVLAAVFAAFVEFSQLLHWPPLDTFRNSTFGALLLGRVFSWWDIVSYWIGIAVMGALDCWGRWPEKEG